MTCTDDSAWQTARLAATEALIVTYENALTALASGAQSYSLNTGQTQQTVTKANIASLRDTLNMQENRRATIRARLYGGGTHVTPNF